MQPLFTMEGDGFEDLFCFEKLTELDTTGVMRQGLFSVKRNRFSGKQLFCTCGRNL